jgi:hypothetical protein
MPHRTAKQRERGFHTSQLRAALGTLTNVLLLLRSALADHPLGNFL